MITLTNAQRRREASRRLVILDTGHADPWRPYRGSVGAYADAAAHLAAAGLLPAPPLDIEQLRELWRSGKPQRDLAARIAAAWGVIR